MASQQQETDTSRVAALLNQAKRIGLGDISSNQELQDLVNTYFGSREQSPDCSEDEDEAEIDPDSRKQPPLSSTEASASPSTSQDPIPSTSSGRTRQELDLDLWSDEDDDDALGASFTEDLSAEVAPDIIVEGEFHPNRRKAPCRCKIFKGQPCFTKFETNMLEEARLSYLALERYEQDLVILAKLECGAHLSSSTKHAREFKDRQVFRTDFFFHGEVVCREFFKWVHSMSQDRLTALLKHFRSVGIEPRQHKNLRRAPKHSLSFSDIKAVVDFIINFAELHAIMLPGRQPGHWKTNIKLLPTNVTKRLVYNEYCTSATLSDIRIVSKRSFYRLWKQLTPFVATMRPASDLCWYCQKNSACLMRAANLPDDEKSQVALDVLNHLEKASKERSYYQEVCEAVKGTLPPGTTLGAENKSDCSYDGTVHYSFDFAQQVHYPSNPLQPGPIFFKTPRKCGLFGVACEALPCQVNFLLEECVSSGKGANCVVSLIHFFLEKYGIGEKHVHFHADNCCGQNKNNCMMQYLMWRVLTGRHLSIKMSFLLTGHTKFSCDWCFGLVKRKFKVTKVDCLEDIAKVVNESATCNISQLCGTEDGTVLVPVYDWTSFLGKFFTKMAGIKRYHHFIFQEQSGSVQCKEFVDSEPVEHRLLVREVDVDQFPVVIRPGGLDLNRQWYLYDEIRQFVAEEYQDRVAPKPLTPKRVVGSDMAGDDDVAGEVEDGDEAPPRSKKWKGKGKGKGRGRGKL